MNAWTATLRAILPNVLDGSRVLDGIGPAVPQGGLT